MYLNRFRMNFNNTINTAGGKMAIECCKWGCCRFKITHFETTDAEYVLTQSTKY